MGRQMQITRIRAGASTEAEIDEILAEVLHFDTLINRASGLGEDFDPNPGEMRSKLSESSDYITHSIWIGRLGGVIVAKGIAFLPLIDNVDTADIWCAVAPEHRGGGLGTRLLDRMETELRTEGRTQLSSYCEIPPAVRDAEPRRPHLAAESGAGTLPTHLPEVSFLMRRGYALKQLERCSVAQIPRAKSASHQASSAPARSVQTAAEDAQASTEHAEAGSGDDGYSIETWQGSAPENRLDQIAFLHQRMSTDVPGAEEFGEEETWDAQRVRALDGQRSAKGEIINTALALHGEAAAGFTEVAHYPDRAAIGWQGATLVAREHRGHGLGARLKLANHRALGETTEVERVYTWNAVENSWMLAINDRAGFDTWAWVGLWKKNQP